MLDDVWMIELLAGDSFGQSGLGHLLVLLEFDDFGSHSGSRSFVFDFEDLSSGSRAQVLLDFELIRKHIVFLCF